MGMSAAWSGFTSGMIRGTSVSIRCAPALLNTGYNAANSASTGPAKSPGNAEKTKSTLPAFSTASTFASTTFISAILVGMFDSMVQLQAFLYFLPADLSDAASTSILNHGCPCNSWMNRCPTAPVAPNMATLRFEDITYRVLCSFELVSFDKNVNGCLASCDFNY